MKIDFHTHIWADQLGRVDDFVDCLDRHGVDRAVVSPIAPHVKNEEIARCVAAAPDRIIGFASVVPVVTRMRDAATDPVSELDYAVRHLGLRGLKLHPLIQGFAIDSPAILEVVSAAGELKVPVLIHTGPAYTRTGRVRNADISLLDDLAIMCPNTILVAGHGNPLGVGPYIARKHPNVYLETSISWAWYGRLMPGLVQQAVELAGADKILYGTDFSLGKEERIAETDRAFQSSGLDSGTLACVYGRNAEHVLGRLTETKAVTA